MALRLMCSSWAPKRPSWTCKDRFLRALALRASLRQVQPALVNVFVPNLLAAGVIDAHADLHGSVTAPDG